jgi:hypothetical protein
MINSIDEILENSSSEPKKSNMKNFLLIGALAVGIIGSGLGIMHNVKTDNAEVKGVQTTQPSQSKSIIDNIKDKVSSTTHHAEKIISPVYEASNLINANNKARIEHVGQFTVPSGLANNQIARHVAQQKLASKDYSQSVLSEGEGFGEVVYPDNVKLALGNGWNLGMQSRTTNENLAKAIWTNPVFIKNAVVLSGKDSLGNPSGYNLSITPQQAMQVAVLLMDQMKPGIDKAIAKEMSHNPISIAKHKATGMDYDTMATKLFNDLPPNIQGMLSYQIYKVGERGFSKYTGMIEALINYDNAPQKSPEAATKIAEHVTFLFTVTRNGKKEVMHDVRSEVLLQALCISPESFGYLIGKNVAPHNMKSLIPAMVKNNIDVTSPAGSVVIPDPYGEIRTAIKNGEDIKVTPEYNDFSQQQLKIRSLDELKNSGYKKGNVRFM